MLIKLRTVSLMKILTLEVLRIWEKALRKELGEFPGSWPCPNWLSGSQPHHSPPCGGGKIGEGLGLPFLSGLCFYYLEGLLSVLRALYSSPFCLIFFKSFVYFIPKGRTSLFVEIDWLNNWTSSGKLDCLGAMFSLSPWKVTLIELGCGVNASEMHWTSAFSVSSQFSLWLNFMETNLQGRSSV